ncbi:UDP-glucose 4-epimerase GalE [Wenzhouxiangella sp. XN79A]|uniref:UDP-glucose 4-epimerase GalE n=1 Tax=Wenzhouxiangella sp. XN79A TaxID=2724193 RepID=UPI001F0F6738|nr:UDP-glucose 4-epimerase GalE [Wenzhouxiangella sp. XN79A]
MTGTILVCGGAGYIGSHMVRLLADRGFEVVVFDDLSTGHRESIANVELVEGDVRDAAALDALFGAFRFEAVMHFCAKSLVGESVLKPLEYYENNVGGSISLVQAMQRHGVDKLVFSSTAAVFGEPESELIDEDHPKSPLNPYGHSKLMVERMLADVAAAHGLRAVALRYFNAAGASLAGGIGESHDPETHLIPNVLKAAAGSGPRLKVFGTDYDTRDGTCVRDYIHVDDLARAHLAALEFMTREEGFHAFNLGNGQGFSVLEVIQAAGKVVGRDVPYEVAERRAGDPAVLVASSALAAKKLGWQPEITDLEAIIESAWHWHREQRY